MGIALGIVFLAVGAVLAFAVNATVSGVDIATVGVILMVVGALSIVLDLIVFMPRRRRTTVVEEGAGGRRVTRDSDVY